MRVAVLFDNLGPYHVARLARAAERMDVLAVEANRTSMDYGWDAPDLPDGLRRAGLDPGDGAAPAGWRALTGLVERRVGPFRPDAVAVPGWSSGAALGMAAWAGTRDLPVIVMSDTNEWDTPRRTVMEGIKRRVVRRFSAGLCAGEPQKRYLVAMGLAPDAVFLGYDVVDNAHFAAGAERVRAAGEMPAMGDGRPLDARWRGRYLLASARFVPKKNLPRLIRAYGLYRARAQAGGDDAWPLVMLGDGAMRAELEALRDELGLAPHIHMPGFRQYGELPAFYGTAGAFILPSTTEQWGLVVNEAMASGLPVLVSRRCGCADTLVRDGANGWTFDPEDERAMAEVMHRVASDTARDGMGRASRQIVAQWGPDRFADGLHAAARRALAAPARKAGPVDSALMRLVASVQDRRRLRHAA